MSEHPRSSSRRAGELRDSVQRGCARLGRSCNGRPANLLNFHTVISLFRTLTPLVEVRILVPQPVDLSHFSLLFDENIPERFESRFEIFVPLSSFRIALSPSAGSLLR